jgi:hypothetical protein
MLCGCSFVWASTSEKRIFYWFVLYTVELYVSLVVFWLVSYFSSIQYFVWDTGTMFEVQSNEVGMVSVGLRGQWYLQVTNNTSTVEEKNMMEVQVMLGKTRCPVGAGSANCSNKAADKVLTVNEEFCWEVISWWTVILLRCDILMVSAPLWKGMLAGPQLHAGIGLAVYARCVVERMSMAEELPGKAKQGSCTINYLSKVFSTWPKWNAWNELFWVVILFMVEYDNSLELWLSVKTMDCR